MIGFAGAVLTDRIQLEALTPIYPLHANLCEDEIALQATSTFGAFRRAFTQLKLYYEQIKSLTPGSADRRPKDVVFPYMNHYTGYDQNHIEFTYCERLSSPGLVFTAATREVDDFIVKFTRRYSEEAHRYCSDKRIAPRLCAVHRPPGGWFMVAMDYLGPPYKLIDNSVGPHLRAFLAPELRRTVGKLHEGGLVHGDIHGINLMFSGDERKYSVVILDFDWAGRCTILQTSTLRSTDRME